MAKLICGVHHVAIKYDDVSQYEKAIHFYHDLLGLEIARTWGEGEKVAAMIDTGSGILEIFANGKDLATNGMIAHVALKTKDVDKCIEIVRNAGYEITIEPKDLAFATAVPYSARLAFCKGPGGEDVEFFCEK